MPRAAIAGVFERVDDCSKRGEPGERDDNVKWERSKSGRERYQPKQPEQDRYSSNDFSVDPASTRPGVPRVMLTKVVAHDSSNDSSKGNLSDTEEDRDNARNDGHGEVFSKAMVVVSFGIDSPGPDQSGKLCLMKDEQ